MKFSIVTPSLNQGRYIRQTIESVLAQQGDFKVEYFVVDGGSTDETVAILDEYQNQGRLRWWKQSGKGQSQAINEGFARATGDIFAWINSDDYYAPGAFATVARAHHEHPAIDLFCGQCYFENESTHTTDLRIPEEPTLENVTVRGHRLYQPATFFTKRIIAQVGPLDEHLHYVMDYELWVRILRQAHALRIPSPLATFRIWGESKTSTAREKFVAEWRTVQKNYGLSPINPKDIWRLTAHFPFSYSRAYFPRLHAALKQILYRIITFCSGTRR